MIDELLLLSGNDLPFFEAQLTIHQPRIKEIAYLTEPKFWSGCELLNFDKEVLIDQDKIGLLNISNFNIIMTMMQEKTLEAQQAKVNVMSILGLMFPTHEISFTKKAIQLKDCQTEEIHQINEENFEIFRKILKEIFCLSNQENKQYNPSGSLAKKIANKFKKGRQQKAKLAPETKIAILSRYISILAVGENKSINDLMNYTIYQLMDEFKRYELKTNYDSWVRYKIAGAKDLHEPEDWLKDIHEE